jgi:mono/diheme cytochrome c family protein
MTRKTKLAICLAVSLGLFATLLDGDVVHLASAQARRIDFRRDVEPILRANCYQCHGAKKASAKLRLDDKELAMKGGISGAVIIPGNSKDSRLMKRVLGEGDESQMPLGGAALKSPQIELIRKWIDQGAVWPEGERASGREGERASSLQQHWAFVAPTRPKPPGVKNSSWVRTPIDDFILARLEKQGLTPSSEADKVTLIRRLSLDLTGLPPTIEEVDQFTGDASPDAYGKLVDRLLGSPHYGERWGRWWLDAARYADTNGFEKDRSRSIWPYRDWVIDAFNKDLPFDQFTVEQLAGDLLPQTTLETRVATGFLRNSMLNQEGGVDPEQFRVEGIIDRVDAVGKAFLGLTVSCAQCHNHKFDPISQTEYYRFYAFLNKDDEPAIEVPDEKIAEKRKEILSKIAKIEDDLTAGDADLPKRMAVWEAGAGAYDTAWTPIKDGEIFAAFGVKFDRLEDGSFIAKGDNATTNNYIVRAKTNLKKITGVRVEFLTDPNLPRGGPGRAPDGSFYFSEFSVEAAPVDKPDAPNTMDKIALAGVTADFELPGSPAKNVIDGALKTHWSSDAGPVRRNQSRQFVFETQKSVSYDNGVALTFQLAQKKDDAIDTEQRQPNIGRFRISVTDAPNPKVDPLPASVRAILSIPADRRSREQRREVFGFYRTTDPAFVEANKKIDELMREWPYGPTTLALSAREIPRETRIFKRGDWKRPGDAVGPGVPAALHPFPKDAGPNRLGLAKWIVDRNNPLTARVIVNRIWQQYFGQGLVTTPEDFGSRCEPPSHPDLLDWLAVEFIESGWSIKHIHRLILNSAVYRQSSKVTPKLLEVDPYNRWLARAPRIRVESEIVRDVALAASGLLNEKIGGPSVFPALPAGVMDLAYGGFKWENATGEDRYRRGMYTFWKRTVPYPSMLVFDSPNGDFSCARRVRSNTPLQALTTLNDTVFVEAAQALAMRIWKNGGADDRSKMNYAFRLCVSREPDQFEMQKLIELLEDQKKYFEGRTSTAVYVAVTDPNRMPDDVDLHKVAPWTMIARVLLNMDETITKE